jgi:VWFA-related protein
MRQAALVGVLWLAAGGARPQDVPVFPTSIEIVRLDVSVTRDGLPVKALKAADFEVRDNGARQDVELVGGDEKAVHAVLALDNSDSVKGAPLAHLKTAAHAVLDVLHPEDAVSLLTFSDRISLKVTAGESRARAHEVVEAAQARRTTALYDATFAALAVADPARGRPLVLVFSDGQDVGSWLDPTQVLGAAKASDLVVHGVVSQHEGTDVTFLQELAAATGGVTWRVEHRELKEAFLRALEEFRSRYTLQYALPVRSLDGWHEVSVRVKRPGVKVRARKGYLRRPARP